VTAGRRTVVVMSGDGIGRVVVPQALRVLAAAGFDAEWAPADIGWDVWVREGDPLPERTIDLLARHKLGLLGAITSKPGRTPDEELEPVLRGRGLVYASPIVALRQRFDLDRAIRPCRSFPGNPLNFVRRTTSGHIEEPAIDAVVFRQNTEDLYAGVAWTDPPAVVRDALATHPKFAPYAHVPGPDLAIATRIFTRRACARITTAAFEHARRHGYRSVTVCEKPNVLRHTSGMMEDEARRAAERHPEIRLESANVDTLLMRLTKAPEELGVVVAGNVFGDLVSDALAGLVGGLGFAPSGNVGDDVAVFEPTHGSAPRHADLDPPIVNPIATILAGAMLAEHAGEPDCARRIRDAVARVVAGGRVRTYDMLRLRGGPGVVEQGAATTIEMTDAILVAL
jgi:3-isopropylmalate dehydrogenase